VRFWLLAALAMALALLCLFTLNVGLNRADVEKEFAVKTSLHFPFFFYMWESELVKEEEVALLMLGLYALTSVVLDLLILYQLPQFDRWYLITLMFAQIFYALPLLIAIRTSDDSGMVITGAVLLIQFFAIALILLYATKPYWHPALAWFASSVWNFLTKFSTPILSVIIVASLAIFVAKLRFGDYWRASLALFFAFASTLALLSTAL